MPLKVGIGAQPVPQSHLPPFAVSDISISFISMYLPDGLLLIAYSSSILVIAVYPSGTSAVSAAAVTAMLCVAIIPLPGSSATAVTVIANARTEDMTFLNILFITELSFFHYINIIIIRYTFACKCTICQKRKNEKDIFVHSA